MYTWREMKLNFHLFHIGVSYCCSFYVFKLLIFFYNLIKQGYGEGLGLRCWKAQKGWIFFEQFLAPTLPRKNSFCLYYDVRGVKNLKPEYGTNWQKLYKLPTELLLDFFSRPCLRKISFDEATEIFIISLLWKGKKNIRKYLKKSS